ncbi:unnamed protein product [Caenorhabditis angaria]|uniref:ZP domain-containing protein n=1 Tax=Caenorhabditis angaria TaxID=860376 RepID=A0A9P1MW91_9PELO|nr:unnamed protein product [Caenorhabditis angaria]
MICNNSYFSAFFLAIVSILVITISSTPPQTTFNIKCNSQKDWTLAIEFIDEFGGKDGIFYNKCKKRKIDTITDIRVIPTHVVFIHNCVSGEQTNMTFTDDFRPEYNFFIDNRGTLKNN